MKRRTPNPYLLRPALSPLCILMLAGSPCFGQLLERATVIKNARIVTMNGEVIDRGDVLIKGGRIQGVGPDVEVPFADRLTARTIDATGKTIAPGFIDVWSGLGLSGAALSPDATASAFDAYNRYAEDDIVEALRNGVTSIYLGPGGRAGIKGVAVIIRLARGENGGIGELLGKDAALCVDLGSEDTSVARARTYQDIRKKFRAAVDYRKSLEEYDEDLKEYIKKLEERKKASQSDKDKPSEKPKGESDSDAGKEKPKGDKPAEEPKPEPKPEEGTLGTIGSIFGVSEGTHETATARGRPPGAPPAGDGKSKDGDGKDSDKKKEDEIKKPTKPKYDPTSEMLLRAIDHKLVVRIEAHRSADILNALALAEEYNLDIVLEGATDGHLLADRIAKADVPVVLGAAVRTGLPVAQEHRRHTVENFGRLREAGVRVSMGSSGEPAGSRFVAMNAQLAMAGDAGAWSSPVAGWMPAVTAGTAELLGISNKVGRIARGLQADLVIWSDDPGEPTAKVEQVFVAGEQVYPPQK